MPIIFSHLPTFAGIFNGLSSEESASTILNPARNKQEYDKATTPTAKMNGNEHTGCVKINVCVLCGSCTGSPDAEKISLLSTTGALFIDKGGVTGAGAPCPSPK